VRIAGVEPTGPRDDARIRVGAMITHAGDQSRPRKRDIETLVARRLPGETIPMKLREPLGTREDAIDFVVGARDVPLEDVIDMHRRATAKVGAEPATAAPSPSRAAPSGVDSGGRTVSFRGDPGSGSAGSGSAGSATTSSRHRPASSRSSRAPISEEDQAASKLQASYRGRAERERLRKDGKRVVAPSESTSRRSTSQREEYRPRDSGRPVERPGTAAASRRSGSSARTSAASSSSPATDRDVRARRDPTGKGSMYDKGGVSREDVAASKVQSIYRGGAERERLRKQGVNVRPASTTSRSGSSRGSSPPARRSRGRRGGAGGDDEGASRDAASLSLPVTGDVTKFPMESSRNKVRLGRAISAGGRVVSGTGANGDALAVRVLSKADASRDPAALKALTAERDAASKFSHPCLAKLVSTLQSADAFLCAYELAEGGKLSSKIGTRGARADAAVFYAAECASALQHVHERHGMALFSLSCDSVLLNADRHLCITDYRLARRASERGRLADKPQSLEFTAPEILDGTSSPGAAADMWALGCLVYFLFTGRPPFGIGDSQVVQGKVRACDVQFPRDMDPRAKELVEKLLIVDPLRRATIRDVVAHPLFSTVSFDKLPRQSPPPL
jgi:hypothetical protein